MAANHACVGLVGVGSLLHCALQCVCVVVIYGGAHVHSRIVDAGFAQPPKQPLRPVQMYLVTGRSHHQCELPGRRQVTQVR